MDRLSDVKRRNQALAACINEEARRNPQSVYAGKFVGLADGQVVIVAETLDEVILHLDRLPADPERTFFIEAGLDYDTPVMIWGIA